MLEQVKCPGAQRNKENENPDRPVRQTVQRFVSLAQFAEAGEFNLSARIHFGIPYSAATAWAAPVWEPGCWALRGPARQGPWWPAADCSRPRCFDRTAR